jgi:diacylglycerol kinase
VKQSFIEFLRSFYFAGAGVMHVALTQRNMRVHITIALATLGLGLWLAISTTEWAIISLAMGGVFAAEMVNTSVERLVDLISPEYHNLARVAKDSAAGGVLIMAIFASLTGLLVFVPKVLQVVSR